MRDANMADTPVSIQWQEHPADPYSVEGLVSVIPEPAATNDAD